MKATSPHPVAGSVSSNGIEGSLPAFEHHPLTRLVVGSAALNQLGELARELGGTRVLLVTDPGLEAAGHPQRALASLFRAGLEAFLFHEVEENPTTKHIGIGLERARTNRIDLL